MPNTNPTIVSASLSDKELQASINRMVANFDKGLQDMLDHSNKYVGKIQESLQKIGNINFGAKGSNYGGVAKQTKQHKELTDAVSKETQKLQDLQQSLSGASDREQNFISQKERAANTIAQENELLSKQQSELAALKTQQQSLVDAEQRGAQVKQQNAAAIEKQREAVANLKNEVKYWQSIVSQLQSGDKKTRFNNLWIGDTTSKQGHDILDVANKLYSIMQKLGMETEKGSASTGQAVKVVEQLAKYYKISREEAEKLVMSVQESPLARGKFTTHYDTRFGLDNLTMQKKDAEDSALRLLIAQSKLERQTDDLALANKRLADSENSSTQSSQQKAQIDAQVAAKEKEIAETKGRIVAATKEQSEAEKNASQAAKEKANIQSQVANQEKQVAEAKKQLTTATQQHTEAETKSSRATKEKSMTLDQQASAINTAVQSEKKYTEEIRKQAAAIRATKEWQEKGWVMIGDNRFFDRDRANATKRERENMLTLEERLVQLQQQEAQEALVAAEAKRQQAQATKESAQADSQTKTLYNYDYTKSVATAKQIGTTNAQEVNYLKTQIADLLGIQEREVQMINVEKASYGELSSYIKQLQSAYQRLGADRIARGEGTDLAKEIQNAQRALQKFQQTMSRPVSLKDTLGGSEKTLDDIAYKMQRLSSYRSGLNVETQKKEIGQVNAEYDRLKKKMDEVMQKNQNMIASNTALGRSWNYMKNRLAFYFTVGASTAFVKNLIEVRSQYEMNERALGILIDSAERGTQIFNELSSMALVSPYTLIELSAAAKQLTAYDVAAKDVVDTTRRLADMAAAVGIPIERLTYALGQIKAYGYLNSRDARMFANAGIPLVKQLSEYYTELEGRLVSTADVYDRIKKKAIDYGDVMQVINKMTDEGGKFYDFQAKMADTLKVQLANLTLAWNNMLNEIGESSRGMLSTGIGAMKELFLHWQQLSKIIYAVAGATGAYIAYQLICNQLFGKGTIAAIKHAAAVDKNNPVLYKAALSTKKLTADEARLLLALNRTNEGLKRYIVSEGILTAEQAKAAMSTKALGTSMLFVKNAAFAVVGSIQKLISSLVAMAPELLPFIAIGAIIELFQTLSDRASALSAVNETIAKNAKESAESIKETLSTLADSGVTAENATKLSANEQKKAWGEIRNAIEMTAAASNVFIESLLKENSADRISKGIGILEDIKNIHEIMALWHDDTINVTEDFKVLGIGADGLSEDLKDFVNAMNKAGDGAERLQEISSGIEGDFRAILSWIYDIESILPRSIPAPLMTFASITGIDFLDPTLNKTVDAYIEVNDEIEKLSSSLMNQLLKDNVENVAQIQEVQQKAINSIAQEKGWSEQQTMNARMLLEQKFADSSVSIFRKSVEDRNTAWNEWMKYLTAHHKTEFTKMGEEEISVEKWSQDSRKKLYENTFEEFKKYNVLAAEQIKDSVNDLSKLQVHIKVYYDEQNQPSWLEKDFKNRLPNSTLNVKEYKSVTDLISGEQKALKDANEEIKRLRNAGVSELDEHFLDVKNRARQATEALDAYNAEHEKETKGKGGGGSKKDPLLDALKQEISLVEKLQGDYDKLTKSGASQMDALAVIRGAYGKTVNLLNTKLGGAGLPTIEIDKLITGKDPNKALAHFKQTLDMLVSKGLLTFERSKELEAIIEKLTLSAKTYNLDRITKGLNNELGKLKEEYELAVELDANPELGGIFADMMGLDKEQLAQMPRDFNGVVVRMQKIINDKLGVGKFNLVENLNKSVFDAWLKANKQGTPEDDAIAKSLESIIDYVNKIRLDSSKKQIEEWNKLLEKYAEYEYKRTQIQKEAEREREVARKKGANQNIINAINNREKQRYAQLDFEEFQKSSYWITATGDLANLSKSAIDILIQRLNTAKKSFKNLDAKQIKQLNSALSKLYKEQRKNNPFKAISNMLQESKERMADFQQEITETEQKIMRIEIMKGMGDATEEQLKELPKLKKKWQELTEAQAAAGEIDATQWVAAINETIGAVKAAIGVFDDLAKAIGGVNNSDLDKAFSVIDKAGQGAAIGAQIGGGYGAIIGAVAGAASELISIFAGAENERINNKIKESERAVNRLELAYIDLEHAVDKAYGTAVVGAKQAVIANKKLQLAEIERQIQLEKSRKAKNRDEDRIIELQKQYKQLKYEIKDTTEEIVNDLLGISSVGDAAENLVSAMIDAFKQGEDYMAKFDESFGDMIDNMIVKAIASEVIGRRIKSIFDMLDKEVASKTQSLQDERVSLEQERQQIEDRMNYLIDLKNRVGGDFTEKGQSEWNALTNRLAEIDSLINNIDNDLVDESNKVITPERVNELRETMDGMRNGIRDEFLAWMDMFGIRYGESASDTQLSQLQQGLQSMSESTANALEAYANSISQQVYYHSSLLEQIRDSVVGLDLDVSLGVQSQMLLQLQNSYQTQQAIQQILEGVLVPSGRAFAVELMS